MYKFISFDGIDQFTPEAVKCYEEAIKEAQAAGSRVRAMILCNPYHPLWKCCQEDPIIAYIKLCQKYSIHLTVGEMYGISIYKLPGAQKDSIKPVPFKSILSIDSNKYIDKNYLHLLYG